MAKAPPAQTWKPEFEPQYPHKPGCHNIYMHDLSAPNVSWEACGPAEPGGCSWEHVIKSEKFVVVIPETKMNTISSLTPEMCDMNQYTSKLHSKKLPKSRQKTESVI